MKFLKRIVIAGFLTCSIVVPNRARADVWGGDVVILVQILANALQQLIQLKQILSTGSDTLDLLKDVNRGIREGLNVIQIINPKFNPGLYGNLDTADRVLAVIKDFYGQAPLTGETKLQEAQDRSVAEGIAMNGTLFQYADQTDEEAKRIVEHARIVNPQGAGKLTAQSLAVLIGVTTQVLRTNSMMLKMMSENMALQNRHEKIQSAQFKTQYDGLSNAFGKLPKTTNLNRWMEVNRCRILTSSALSCGIYTRNSADSIILMLPVCFALAITLTWFQSGQQGASFIDCLKRAIVSTVLLVAFPDISRAIIFVADGIAERIDNFNSIDTVIRMAQEKAASTSTSPISVLLQFNDLIIATISFASYLILYIARYLTIAMYHFFWTFFMVSSPLLILFNLFPSTSQITKNLFKGMIEVACWKIVWAILGAMLSALAFGEMYRSEGSYLVLIVMNLVIAIAMLATPLMVRSLVGPGLQSVSTTIGTAAASAMVPAKLFMVANKTRSAVTAGQSYVKSKTSGYRNPQSSGRNHS